MTVATFTGTCTDRAGQRRREDQGREREEERDERAARAATRAGAA